MNAQTIPLDRELLRRHVTAVPHESEHQDPRPILRAVTAAPPRKRVTPLTGGILAAAVVVVTIFAQLGLSIAVSEGAYEARALELELRDLTRVERVLALNTEKLSSPQNLAENATKLGMVQNLTPATLRLSDHTVLGALGGATHAVTVSSVPNATLQGLPVVDAEGLLVHRNPEQAAVAEQTLATTPIAWEGALPAPQTH